MSKIKWYYFKAEGSHDTNDEHCYFTARYEEQARAKARILHGHNRSSLEKLAEINEANDSEHKAVIEELMQSGKDDFDCYITKYEEDIFEMIQVLEKYI